ncbi:MAG: hypothetical protein WDW36_005518 [Sanguina aurantia]
MQRSRIHAGEEPSKETSTSDRPVLPPGGPTPPGNSLQVPKEVVEKLKATVFGYDTFWITSVENYQDSGVVFQGNVRGKDIAEVYKKMQERLLAAVGDKYQLYLLEDRESRPTAVVLPRGEGMDETIDKGTEVWLATLFGIATVVTTINSNGAPLLQWMVSPFYTLLTPEMLQDAAPATLLLWFILGSHEFGHWQAAKRHGLETYLPFVIPAGFGFVGSFGAITRLRKPAPNRNVLLDFAVSGPALGTGVSAAMLLMGFGLTRVGIADLSIDPIAFADSLGIQLAAFLFIGEASLAQSEIPVSSLLIAGWAGLIVNALNLIPAGELDGGRMSLAVFGRRTSGGLGALAVVMLGIGSFTSTLALYWVIFLVLLQRGPVLPCNEELSAPPEGDQRNTAIALLMLPLLILVPYPVDLLDALVQALDPQSSFASDFANFTL